MKNTFNFKSIKELLSFAEKQNSPLPYFDSISPLFEPYLLNGKNIANRIAVHPMEGGDAEFDGSPGELTFRRYNRYAAGGNGLIWFEATAISKEGKSNRSWTSLPQSQT